MTIWKPLTLRLGIFYVFKWASSYSHSRLLFCFYTFTMHLCITPKSLSLHACIPLVTLKPNSSVLLKCMVFKLLQHCSLQAKIYLCHILVILKLAKLLYIIVFVISRFILAFTPLLWILQFWFSIVCKHASHVREWVQRGLWRLVWPTIFSICCIESRLHWTSPMVLYQLSRMG